MSRPTPTVLLPFEPIEKLIPHRDDGETGRVDEIAQALGIARRQVHRYRKGVSFRVADRLACRLGLVPALIEGWPEPPDEDDDEDEDDE